MQDTLLPSSGKQEIVKMYATRWCGDCRMAKRWFDSHGVSYDYINIEEDDQAAELRLCSNPPQPYAHIVILAAQKAANRHK